MERSQLLALNIDSYDGEASAANAGPEEMKAHRGVRVAFSVRGSTPLDVISSVKNSVPIPLDPPARSAFLPLNELSARAWGRSPKPVIFGQFVWPSTSLEATRVGCKASSV